MTPTLEQCPACHRDISTSAVACPHCGHPLHAPRKSEGAFMQTMNIGCVMVLVLILAVIGVFLLLVVSRGCERERYTLPAGVPASRAPVANATGTPVADATGVPAPLATGAPVAGASGSGTDDRDLKWLGACSKVAGFVNTLFPAAQTSCVPAGYAAKGGKGGSLMLIADKPVLSTPKSRKGWLFSIVGAVGLAMNDAPSLACAEIVVADSEGIQQRKGFAMPCPFVKQTQRDIKADKLTIDEAWSRIEKELRPLNVPKR